MDGRSVRDWAVRVVFGCGLASLVAAQVTTRVSVSSTGVQGNGTSNGPCLSADGRFVAYYSDATNLVPGDANAVRDVFVRDRLTGTTERVSVDSSGNAGNGLSGGSMISADGRWVVFHSDATNLVAGDTNAARDAFLRDRQTGTTTRISVDSSGAQGNGASSGPSISDDGRYVAFYSDATNLVPGDTNGVRDVFLRDLVAGTTTRISVDSNGVQSNAKSEACVISHDGLYVVYASDATNLVAGDTNAVRDVFRYDRITATTIRISVDSSGTQGNGISNVIETVGTAPNTSPINGVTTISDGGRYVSFYSSATNLVSGDTNAKRDVFLRDVQLGTTVRVSVSTSGTQGNDDSSSPNITPDGRFVAFYSDATNLVSGDTNAARDVFVHDMQTGSTVRVSVDSAGNQANNRCSFHAMTADGRFVALAADATNLVAGDTNAVEDVFVRDTNATAFTSLCDPGVAGVLACPCGNAPSGSGRGCNNSSGTGGASISASGAADLSADDLVFTTSGEKPTATSIVLQGTTGLSAGTVYGQGIRCVGGTLKRLFTKAASGGSITAPNFGAGDPPVSARSAAKGDVIQPGQSRWYLVYYRDPTVLGGCPATSTFNATQTGRVDWSL